LILRAGIVGCGRIGSEFDKSHAWAYGEAQGVELAALSDLDEQKLAKAGDKWQITSLYRDYREMLHKENLDMLSVCTPNSTHLELTGEAINSGVKAIYCEKPIADTLQNADEMIKLCHEQGVILQINHQRRFDGLYQEVRGFLDGGSGSMQRAAFHYTRGIANTGSHMFDLLRFLFGDAAWVEAGYSEHKSHDSKDPNIDGTVKFSSGLECDIKAGKDQGTTMFDMDLVGSRGRLRIIRNGLDIEYYETNNGVSQLKKVPFNSNAPRNSMVRAVEHLLLCLKEGRESASSGEEGRAALELICAFYESAAGGSSRVTLPLKDGRIEIKSS